MHKTNVNSITLPVEINSDMGEALGRHTFGHDLALMDSIDVANVACGFHSGDPETMMETVFAAKDRGVKVGAHPGLQDIVGFGRREMKLSPSEAESLILYQVGALVGFLKMAGMELNHIKPHGALYGMLSKDAELMRAAAKVAQVYQVPVYGLAGTVHQSVCEEMGVQFIGELYVDRNYGPSGELLIDRHPKPTDPEVAAERVRRVLTEGVVEIAGGSLIEIDFSSICVHSDAPNSPAVAQAVRDAVGVKVG